MIEYTKAMHVVQLRKMLKMENPCSQCPAEIARIKDILSNKTSCKICKDFIRVVEDDIKGDLCPCNMLGREEALKRTHLALEEYENDKEKNDNR